MSVLVITPRYVPNPGGIERLLSHVLPALGEEGHEFVVVTGTDGPAQQGERIDGVPVYRLPFSRVVQSGRPAGILELASKVRDVELAHGVEARHVHGFGDIGLWFILREHRRRPCPLAVSVHGTLDGRSPIGPIARQLLRSADIVSAVSTAVRSSVVDAAPEVADGIRVISNALPGPQTPSRPWQRGPLLAIGRLDDQKGFDVAIDALGLLGASHRDLRLVVVGTGGRQDDLRARAARLGLDQRVRFVGQLSAEAVRSALNDASLVLVPSRTTEGFSLVALEAAQMGRPVIASRVGGLVETIQDGVTGTIVPPGDPAALAGAIEALLDDPDSARAMARAAPGRAAERFDFMTCVQAYDQLYHDLDERARTPLTVGAREGHG